MKTELPEQVTRATETPERSGPAPEEQDANFVETALKLGGKSEEEARTTGTIDRADEHVEKLFEPRYQTMQSPIHRAVWSHHAPIDLFQTQPVKVSESCARAMEQSLEIARRHRAQGTLLDD